MRTRKMTNRERRETDARAVINGTMTFTEFNNKWSLITGLNTDNRITMKG